MSLIADLIRAGVDPDLVARVAEEIALARETAARGSVPTRSKHAEAQAKYRAKKAEPVITCDHNDHNDHDDHGDVTPSPFFPPIKNSPTPPKKLTPLYPPNPEPSLRSVSPAPSRLAELFETEFWPAYPRRIGKAAARKAFDLAVKRGADPATIVTAARRFAGQRQGEDPNYTPHPATWLNAGRWDDEPDQAHRKPLTGGDLMARLAFPELFNPTQGDQPHDQPAYDLDLTRAAAGAAGAPRLSRFATEFGGGDRRDVLDPAPADPDRLGADGAD